MSNITDICLDLNFQIWYAKLISAYPVVVTYNTRFVYESYLRGFTVEQFYYFNIELPF